MSIIFFMKGLAAGAFIAFPVGPIGIFCLRRMLSQGALIGIISGIGGATADIVYASIAIVGLSFISSFLQYHSILFRVISGLFLCILGLGVFFAQPPRPRATWTRSMIEAYFSTFFLTLSNPLLILSFAALFAALHVDYLHSSYLELCALIFGVFVGSSLWWLTLGGFTSLFRISILPKTIERINKISGIAILLFGLGTVISIIIK